MCVFPKYDIFLLDAYDYNLLEINNLEEDIIGVRSVRNGKQSAPIPHSESFLQLG